MRHAFRFIASLLVAASFLVSPLVAEEGPWTAEAFAGLTLRGLGPALMSGRIADIAKDPTDESVWYVAVASGGVWKTRNNGTTWTPIFDDQPSYSIGTVVVDPTNPHVVWVGTGENNSQRSVGWGDGVYKSLDGGETWRRMGLERSEHIGKIVLDPRDSDIVWVAAQGPLWAAGGERGLYKSLDGGETWALSLDVGENTGVTDVVLDPRDPDTLYAAAFQRRRRQWALVAGGPESALYKSTDGGASWRQLEHGLPRDDMGRIGLALSPQDPDVVYATIPAIDEGGFYRSENRGETWTKMSDYVAVDPQYYQEIFPDPHRFDRVYVMDVWIQVSDDGGATWRSLSSEHKHVDNHALLFDADDPEYLMVGCDGGIYESWDRGTSWRFVDNLAVTQFYRVGIDDAEPFYNVYGGTQDNDTQGGPSRTTFQHGIRNSDWFITVGGDGYQTRAEPGNPDILYSLWQYGGLVRHDKKSGEIVDLQPQPDPGAPPLRWQWDSPLLISPHDPTRVYLAAQKLFRTDDRGHAWRAVSPDLTRQLDRNRLEVMGTVWSVDSVWKNVFTSPYGSIVSFDESARVEGLLYAGTDDGVLAVSENGGADWRRTLSEDIAGVPEMTYVSDLTASSHHDDRVYAAFNHHKSGDFAPYLLRSNDRGRRWKSIAGNLPVGHVVWSIVEDPVDPDLLFVGTEFGLFFTRDGGERWIPLRGGFPTVGVRDLEIQAREDDLVVGTFGRGIYIFDDYSVLRQLDNDVLAAPGALFSVRDPWMYLENAPLGAPEKASQGASYFTAPNPPFGAVFTYHLGEDVETLRARRRAEENAKQAKGEPVYYPSWDELRVEDREAEPRVELVVRDADGAVVRRITGPTTRGFHRVAWDLRYPSGVPVRDLGYDNPWAPPPAGPLAAPGTYSVTLTRWVGGVAEILGDAQTFVAKPLGNTTLPAEDREALLAFQRQAGALQRAARAASSATADALAHLTALEQALDATANPADGLRQRAEVLRQALLDAQTMLDGDRTVASRAEPTSPSIVSRVERVIEAFWTSTAATTATHQRTFEVAAEAFRALLPDLREILEEALPALVDDAQEAGAPWTTGSPIPPWPPSDGE